MILLLGSFALPSSSSFLQFCTAGGAIFEAWERLGPYGSLWSPSRTPETTKRSEQSPPRHAKGALRETKGAQGRTKRGPRGSRTVPGGPRLPICVTFLTLLGGFWEGLDGKWNPYETCTGMSGLHVTPSFVDNFLDRSPESGLGNFKQHQKTSEKHPTGLKTGAPGPPGPPRGA